MQGFFIFFFLFLSILILMQQIFRFWVVFIILFLGTVLGGIFFWWDSNIIIGILLWLYFIFQGIAVWRGIKQDERWLFSAIILQLLFSTLGPLYYSNFWDPVYEFITGEWFTSENAFYPCHLCWWARILMFPLLPLSILAFFSRSRQILWYIYSASLVGIFLESFHYMLQKTSLPNPFGCTDSNPCSALGVQYFGFITIPFLCLIAFLMIHIFVSCILFMKKLEKNRK